MTNVLICLFAMAVGVYTFVKHLNAFNADRTSAVDAWLVAVGTMAWSFALYANLNFGDDIALLSHIVAPIHIFALICWVGDNLKIQKHCRRFLKAKLKKGATK